MDAKARADLRRIVRTIVRTSARYWTLTFLKVRFGTTPRSMSR
jgi:hypothetical protein